MTEMPPSLTIPQIAAYYVIGDMLESASEGSADLDSAIRALCTGLLLDDRPFTFGDEAHACEVIHRRYGCAVDLSPSTHATAQTWLAQPGEGVAPFFARMVTEGADRCLATAALAVDLWVNERWPDGDVIDLDGRLVIMPAVGHDDVAQREFAVDFWPLTVPMVKSHPTLRPATVAAARAYAAQNQEV